jgi:lysylphosphatidylglycerol synthetase-like protein (DUF2156 family)
LDKDLLKLLIDRNLTFMELVAYTTMTWWASSIVFCATIIGLSWWHRERVAGLRRLNWFCWAISAFFVSLPLYTILVFFLLVEIETETRWLLFRAGSRYHAPFAFRAVEVAVGYAGLCISVVLILWALVVLDLRRLAKREQHPTERFYRYRRKSPHSLASLASPK